MSTATMTAHAFDLARKAGRPPYKVADLALADWGRKEIRLAEQEMPGLMALRDRYEGKDAARRRAHHGLAAHDDSDRRPDRDARRLGADVRWVSCNIFSTQDHAAAAVVVGRPETGGTTAAPRGIPVFAWKGETLEEYWWCTTEALRWPDGSGPTLIVDDGGDATLYVHKAYEFEQAGKVPAFDEASDPEEWGVILDVDPAGAEGPRRAPGRRSRRGIRGVSEETTTGVHRLYEMMKNGTLLFPAINVNDSVTKSKFDNIYGCRHSLPDGLARASDVMLGGKLAVVFGYGEVGKGCAQALRGQGCRVVVTEIDPICALQAAMEGYEVVRIEDVVAKADIFITATGNLNIITVGHMARMKDKAIVGNIGHFDNEIDMAGLKKLPGITKVNIKPQYDEWQFPDGHSVLVLAEGRLLNLGCATGHPSFVMSASFTNQVLAQLELHEHAEQIGKQVLMLPKKLDEEVARLHLDKLGVRLTRLSDEQAEATSASTPTGPYKPEHYRVPEADGSRLTADGSRLTGHGSRAMAHGPRTMDASASTRPWPVPSACLVPAAVRLHNCRARPARGVYNASIPVQWRSGSGLRQTARTVAARSYAAGRVTIMRTRLTFGIVATGLLVACAAAISIAQRPGATTAQPGPQGGGVTLLPNGWRIAPAGHHLSIGDKPLNMVLSPDGHSLIVTNNGYQKPTLRVVDLDRETVAVVPLDDAWLGLAWHPDGTKLYSSGAASNTVQELDWETAASGRQEDPGDRAPGGPPAWRHAAAAGEQTFVGGIAVNRDGTRLTPCTSSVSC